MRLAKIICLVLLASPLTAQVKTFVTYTPVAWSSSTSYAVNDMVTTGTGGSLITYISLIPNNLNNNPSSTLGSDWNVIGSAANGGGGGTVTTTGSPVSGNMAKFSGPTSITNAVPGTDYISGVNGTNLTQTSGVASINLGNANTWSGTQTFGNVIINGTCTGCGGGAVTSVSNSDSTLTISPTTGAVVSSLNLTHANTWTGLQTFSAGVTVTHIIGSGTTPTIVGATDYTATLDANAHDSSGAITIVASSGAAAGTVATLTFGNAFGTVPHCVLWQGNEPAAESNSVVFSTASTTAAVLSSISEGPLSPGTYLWNYICLQ